MGVVWRCKCWNSCDEGMYWAPGEHVCNCIGEWHIGPVAQVNLIGNDGKGYGFYMMRQWDLLFCSILCILLSF